MGLATCDTCTMVVRMLQSATTANSPLEHIDAVVSVANLQQTGVPVVLQIVDENVLFKVVTF